MSEKLLAFDIWGDYGYFRRGFTTTSTISFPFPSRTTIAGLVSAFLGLERDSYYELFNEDNSKIGINILNPVKKTRISLNQINTKEGFTLSDIKGNKRTQVCAEFLKDPKFRVYVSLDDSEIMGKLFNYISEHKSVYTPYLGISECIANFELVGDDFFKLDKYLAEDTEGVNIDSIVLKDNSKIIIEPNKKYASVKSPGFMNNERIVSKYLEFYYEEKAGSIKIANGEYYSIGDDNVMLF